MFKAVGIQEAQNEHGVSVLLDGHELRYQDKDHIMYFGAQPGPPRSPNYDVALAIYFPLQLQWYAPRQHEPVSSEKTSEIENHLREACEALRFQADFTIPMESAKYAY